MRSRTVSLTLFLVTFVLGCTDTGLTETNDQAEKPELEQIEFEEFLASSNMSREEFEDLVWGSISEGVQDSLQPEAVGKSAGITIEYGIVRVLNSPNGSSETHFWVSARNQYQRVFLGMFGITVSSYGNLVENFIERGFLKSGRFWLSIKEVLVVSKTPYVDISLRLISDKGGAESINIFLQEQFGNIYLPNVSITASFQYANLSGSSELGAFDYRLSAEIKLPENEQTGWIFIEESGLNCEAEAFCEIVYGYAYDDTGEPIATFPGCSFSANKPCRFPIAGDPKTISVTVRQTKNNLYYSYGLSSCVEPVEENGARETHAGFPVFRLSDTCSTSIG